MHVGVLIKAYGNTKEEARERAERLLFNEQYVFEGNYDESLSLWDYPYTIIEDGVRFHECGKEDNYVESGMFSEDYDKLGKTYNDLIKIFDFFGIATKYWCKCRTISEFESEDIDEDFERDNENEKSWFFIGTCHI